MNLEERVAKLEAEVAAIKSNAAPQPDKDFPIRVGKFKGRKPSELTVKELEGQAWFKEKLVKEDAAKPDGERKDPKYVEYDKRDAENFRAWAAFKKAGGIVAAETDTQNGTPGEARYDVDESEPF